VVWEIPHSLNKVSNSTLWFESLPHPLSLTAVLSGRLMCDTYNACKELLRHKNYRLEEMAQTQLGITRPDLPMDDVSNHICLFIIRSLSNGNSGRWSQYVFQFEREATSFGQALWQWFLSRHVFGVQVELHSPHKEFDLRVRKPLVWTYFPVPPPTFYLFLIIT